MSQRNIQDASVAPERAGGIFITAAINMSLVGLSVAAVLILFPDIR